MNQLNDRSMFKPTFFVNAATAATAVVAETVETVVAAAKVIVPAAVLSLGLCSATVVTRDVLAGHVEIEFKAPPAAKEHPPLTRVALRQALAAEYGAAVDEKIASAVAVLRKDVRTPHDAKPAEAKLREWLIGDSVNS